MNIFRFVLIIFLLASFSVFFSIQLFNDSNSDFFEIEQAMIAIDIRQDSIEQEFTNTEKTLNQVRELLRTTTQSLDDFQILLVNSQQDLSTVKDKISNVQQNVIVVEAAIADSHDSISEVGKVIEKTQDSISLIEQNYLNTDEEINFLKTNIENIQDLNADLIFIVDKVIASVVVIEAVQGFFSVSQGSGFVIDGYGHIITNYHVIENSTSITVRFLSGDIVSAELVGSDPSNDLAVLLVASDLVKLAPVEFDDSSEVRIGENVFAIGSPFSEDFSVSAGIVSAIDRNTTSGFTNRQILNVIQTDASINPGNSGGPLFNFIGKVIGVNTAITGPSGFRGNVGLGFAVPSNTVKRFLPKMKIGEKIKHPQLGVSGRQLTPILSEEIPDPVKGFLVTESSGGASQAGILAGDIIQGINGVEIKNFTGLAAEIDKYNVEDQVSVSVVRGTEEIIIVATLLNWR